MTQESLAISARPSKFYRERTIHPLTVVGDIPVPKEFTHVKVSDLPDFVQEGTFIDPDYNIPIRFRYTQPPVIRGTVMTAITGLKENISLSNARMKEMYDQGVPYICLELPNAGEYTNIMPLYEKYVKFFLLHKDSPVHQLFPNLDKEVECHSTGGLISLMLALRDEPKEMKRQYKALFCDAPFTDNPNSSEQDHWIPRTIFTLYAKFHRNRLVEQTILGNYYMIDGDIEEGKIVAPANPLAQFAFKVGLTAKKMAILWSGGQPWEKDADGLEGSYRLPTYGQILELRERGRALKKYLRENPQAAKEHLPIVIYSHERDRFSSHKSTAYIAELIGARLVPSKGFHNNLNNDNHAAADFQNSIEARLHNWPLPELTIERHPPAWPLPKVFANSVTLPNEYLMAQPDAPTVIPAKSWTNRFPLPDVFKFPVEAPVRLFNTATNFLQRAFSHNAGKDYSSQNAKKLSEMRVNEEFSITIPHRLLLNNFVAPSGHVEVQADFNGYAIDSRDFPKLSPLRALLTQVPDAPAMKFAA